jgi:alpha-glucosidase (family GH31 glycosyl hydrolase)
MDIMLKCCSVLPDMIGGNGDANAELIVRWAQANTFMPTMQFSNLPWEIASDDVL